MQVKNIYLEEKNMKAGDIQAYLRSLNGGWVDLNNTTDTFKAGDPDTEVTGIAVSWMSTTWALQKALKLGCNMFITHEPTYFSNFENDQAWLCLSQVKEKRTWIEKSGMVILRCHDLWDQYPKEGIPDSWANFLGLGESIGGQGYFRIYDVSGRTAGEVARQIASKTKAFGQEAVELIGSADKPVTRLVLGTGAITPYLRFIDEYKADIALCTNDGLVYWRDAAFAAEMGFAIIVTDHKVSEEAGVASLANHIIKKFPSIPIHHIPQQCIFKLVTAG